MQQLVQAIIVWLLDLEYQEPPVSLKIGNPLNPMEYKIEPRSYSASAIAAHGSHDIRVDPRVRDILLHPVQEWTTLLCRQSN